MSVTLLTAPGGPRRRTSPDSVLRRRARSAGRRPRAGVLAPVPEVPSAEAPHAESPSTESPSTEPPSTEPPGAEPSVAAVGGPVSRAASLRARLAGGGASDAGMATAEYAIATVAAAGFAGLLLLILRSDEVRGLLLGIVRGALQV